MWRTRAVVLALCLWPASIILQPPAVAQAQVPPPASAPSLISMEDAVRIALQYNQALRAQRLNIDQSKAGEITAALKPNPVLGNLVDTIPIFSPQTIRLSTQIYEETLNYTVERGGKREKRVAVAKGNTDVAAKTVADNERQLRFQVTQAFINVLLAKSVLLLAQDNLANYSQQLDLNKARLTAGDLAEADYIKLSLQKLQFEQDVSAAQLSLVQSKANLRQQLGYQSVADNYDVTGMLARIQHAVQLEDLEKQALVNRPDLQAAHSGVKVASDTVALALGNKVRDWTWGTDYTNQNFGINGVGVSLSFELPFHDRNQGEIARSQAAVKQAQETESSTQVGVLTDVVNAYYGFQTSDQVVGLFEGGYLDQATQSRDLSTYAYQRGAASILDLLDAERSYRATQLAYRQALAAQMIAAEQVNLVVGTQVIK
ncbi:MAG TPA: TolC family protein [Bryobacteraceae bacterium]|nr:TolC family protein [Bryobacteraceae bacterium]